MNTLHNESNELYESVFSGVDAKFLQYGLDTMPEQMMKRYNDTILKRYHDEQIVVSKPINFIGVLSELFKKDVDTNIVVINIEKDIERYKQTEEELKKLCVNKYFHLKATYWKNKKQTIDDLNYVMTFLKKFNENIPNNFKINDFSECSDPNIFIQDGPLACYISHLRAMIYGYLNFKDYTVVLEDDIDIRNTELIEEQLLNVPNDWDMIFMNCSPKNISYGNSKIYRLTNEFHSTHFYIIKNSFFPNLFSKLYPVTDQVDVLISDNFMHFNYYNIPSTVFQRNISTNTQNNLYCIYSSPHYGVVRKDVDIIKEQLKLWLDEKLFNNQHNEKLVLTMLFDIIYNHIKNVNKISHESNKFESDPIKSYNEFIDDDKHLYKLIDALFHFLFCTEKGTNIMTNGYGLVSNIVQTTFNFKNFNDNVVIDNHNYKLEAYSYGSTCVVYKAGEYVIKKYIDTLRWKTHLHINPTEIYQRELIFLLLVKNEEKCVNLIDFDYENKEIVLKYEGECLFEKFLLPENWKNQIREIFEVFSKYGIEYTEFNLKNILVNSQNKIKLIDFGLARFNKNHKNHEHCEKFIQMLEILNMKLDSIENNEMKMLYCKIFVDNIKLHQDTRFSQYIY